MASERLTELEARVLGHLDAADLTGAAETILRGFGPDVVGYLHALARDEHGTFEVFAQFSEDLWRGLPGFRRESSVRTWLYALAYAAFIRYARDGFRRKASPLSDLSYLVDEVRSATAPWMRSEVRDSVLALRAQLTPAEQTLLILRIDRAMSWAEVAAVMAADGDDVSVDALAKRFERVKTKLRGLAREAGLLTE